MFVARNKEFVRDREAFGWNLIFPFMIIVGFALMFERGVYTEYKLGIIFPENPGAEAGHLPPGIKESKFFKFIEFEDKNLAFEKLRHHKLDLIIEKGPDPLRYWIGAGSPKGALAESLILSSLHDPADLKKIAVRRSVNGVRIDYIDWLFPGILANNMMFSALFGVGYVIVRYRKNGVLKRLKATPLTPFEYLSAQVVSRLILILLTNIIVYAVCAWMFDFQCKGSYFDLIIVYSLGSTSMISMGLIIAARIKSEEFATGILNLISWPMMFLSEVWFSLEGATEGVRVFSKCLPLTHVTEAMRKVMNEGAGLGDLGLEIAMLSATTVILMAVGSVMFKWVKD